MRGHIRKRGSTYSIVVDVGNDENGKRKQKWYSGYKTKKEAEKALADIIAKIEKGEYFEPEKMSLATYLDYWLGNYAKTNVAASTYKRYTEFAAHIKTNLGSIMLPKLKPAHIQSFYSTLLEQGLSKSTVLKVHRMLHLALKHAVNWQIIISNPADAVTPPRPDKVEMHVWDMNTVNQFLNDVSDEPIYMPVLLALQTGMREGEICGLKWEDVNLKQGTLTVKQALQRINGILTIKDTKTAKSKRTIALMDYTVQALKEHKKQQNTVKLMMGPAAYHDQGFVCAWDDGRPYDPHYVGEKFTELIDKLDYPKIRFHDLRHTHATMLLQQGVNPKIVSERLGHSQVSITLDTYSHVLPNMQKEAITKLDELFIK